MGDRLCGRRRGTANGPPRRPRHRGNAGGRAGAVARTVYRAGGAVGRICKRSPVEARPCPPPVTEEDAARFEASGDRLIEEFRRDPGAARRFLISTGMYEDDPETGELRAIGLDELNRRAAEKLDRGEPYVWPVDRVRGI